MPARRGGLVPHSGRACQPTPERIAGCEHCPSTGDELFIVTAEQHNKRPLRLVKLHNPPAHHHGVVRNRDVYQLTVGAPSGLKIQRETGISTSGASTPSHLGTSSRDVPCSNTDVSTVKKTTLKMVAACGSPASIGKVTRMIGAAPRSPTQATMSCARTVKALGRRDAQTPTGRATHIKQCQAVQLCGSVECPLHRNGAAVGMPGDMRPGEAQMSEQGTAICGLLLERARGCGARTAGKAATVIRDHAIVVDKGGLGEEGEARIREDAAVDQEQRLP
jgi:hypothetical protein